MISHPISLLTAEPVLTNEGVTVELKPNLVAALAYKENIQGVTGETDQTSGGCSLC